ncbi:BppU family phage baseplate upper protein [Lactococcus garvieae]|uniref:BppU family phage baseplate upper protein n=1 Tax=Lactococcus garvieae TaxID=1363 RepID=UPI003852C43B
MAYKTLNLDLAKSPILKPIIYGRIGDSDMQTVTVNITSRDVPVNLTGYTLTFEGITNGSKTKVFDVGGIKPVDLAKGTFTYTFPNMAFAVGGSYEIAYFSIVKGNQRDTTGEFDIIVGSNADIDAKEAETIITEYNKLVEKLHAITNKYIADSDAKFADINKKITSLQSQITEYQANVKKTADDAVSAIDSSVSTAVSTVNSSSNAAIKAVDDALKQFEAGDFYTKPETDAKFKVVNDLIISQDIPEGSNLDDYKKEGEFSKKTPTVVTGAPEGVTGAFRLSVRAIIGSSGIFQTLYDYATRRIYYRVGNTSLGFNLPWQRIATTDDIKEITSGDTDWQETTLSGAFKGNAPQWKCYRGKEVRVNFSNLTNNNQLSSNTPYTIFNLPSGYRPLDAQEDVIIIRAASNWTLTRLLFNTNGTVQIVPANTIPVNTGFSGSGTISIE